MNTSDTPSSIVIEQLYLALERSHDKRITLFCLLAFFIFLSIYLIYYGITKKKQKDQLETKYLLLRTEAEHMKWLIFILECHTNPAVVLGKRFHKIMTEVQNADQREHYKNVYYIAFLNFMTLQILERKNLKEVLHCFGYILNIPQEYNGFRYKLANEISERTKDHVYILFSKWLQTANYEGLLGMYRNIDARPVGPNDQVEWQGMLWFYRDFISQKNSGIDPSDFFLAKIISVTKQDFERLKVDSTSDFDDYIELYHRDYTDSDTESKIKLMLVEFRDWAQNHVHVADHSKEAVKIITELAGLDLLVNEPEVPADS